MIDRRGSGEPASYFPGAEQYEQHASTVLASAMSPALTSFEGLHWGAALTEIMSAPTRDPGAVDAELGEQFRGSARRVVAALGVWQDAGSLEIRYQWSGARAGGSLRTVLIARTLGRTLESARGWAGQMLKTTTALFPPGFTFGSVASDPDVSVEAWAEIERLEEVRQPGPLVPGDVASFYYLPHPLGGSGAGWSSLTRSISSLPGQAVVSVVIAPTAVTSDEREALDRIRTMAAYLSQPQSGYDFYGNARQTPADAGARDLDAMWSRYPLVDAFLARIAVGTERASLSTLTAAVAAAVTSRTDSDDVPRSYKVVDDLNDFEQYQTGYSGTVQARARHPLWRSSSVEVPWSLHRMPYVFSVDEAASLFLLPVPDEQGVAGVTRARAGDGLRPSGEHDEAGPVVALGTQRGYGGHDAAVTVPLAALNRHALVVGSTGAGKTTTVLTILAQLWRDHHVPFIVIEPTKTEYRSLLAAGGFEELRVVSLGRDDVAPLRLNPLQPPPGVRCEVHRGAVLAALKLALPLPPPLPQLLEEALEHAYDMCGWDESTRLEDGLQPPTLRTLADSFTTTFASKGYRGEARDVGVALEVRLHSLLRGSRGLLLDTVESDEFSDLLRRPTIIELNEIADNDDKLVVAAFLLDRVRAAAQARGTSGGALRHVTVVEEAHRLLARAADGTGDATSGNMTRAQTVQVFCDAISELRAYGEGFVLASQRPSDLARAAVANTNVRVIHRLEDAADRGAMLDDLDASGPVVTAASQLAAGQVIARWGNRSHPELVSVKPSEGVDTSQSVSGDTVRTAMAVYTARTRALLPFTLCTRQVCADGCDPGVRAAGRRLAAGAGGEAGAVWIAAPRRIDALPKVADILTRSAPDSRTAYCGAAHLNRNAVALNVAGVDVRPDVIVAIAKSARSSP